MDAEEVLEDVALVLAVPHLVNSILQLLHTTAAPYYSCSILKLTPYYSCSILKLYPYYSYSILQLLHTTVTPTYR